MTQLLGSRRSLDLATQEFTANLEDGALAYLAERGINEAVARSFHLGVVVPDYPGYEHVAGRLSIPYLTPHGGVVNMRFRCLQAHDCKAEGCPKYLGLDGKKGNLYNVGALHEQSTFVLITEGELDALVLNGILGLPAVGVPGAQAWQPHFVRCFADHDEVIVPCDGDQAGRSFGKKLAEEMEQARAVAMPPNMDVNEVFVELGAEALLERLGVAA